MLKNKVSKSKYYLFLLPIVILLVSFCLLSVYPSNTASAYTSVGECSAVATSINYDNDLQFNQLISKYDLTNNFSQSECTLTKDNGTITINGTAPRYTSVYLIEKNIALNPSHKYYISFNSSIKGSNLLGLFTMFNTILGDYVDGDNIITNKSKLEGMYFRIQNEGFTFENVTASPILIDLTEMFGVGKEPQAVEEVEKVIPKGTYIPYTPKPIPAKNIFDLGQKFGYENGYNKGNAEGYEIGYTDGTNAYVDSLNYTILSRDIFNSVFCPNLSYYDTNLSKEQPSLLSKTSYKGKYRLAWQGYLCIPLLDTISSGQQITLNIGETYFTGLEDINISVGYINTSGLFTELCKFNYSIYGEEQPNPHSITFLANTTIDTLCLFVDSNVYLDEWETSGSYFSDISIGTHYLVDTELINKSFEDGKKQGFENGYNKGVQDGLEESKNITTGAWLSSMFHNLGELFQMKLFGQVTIGSFVAIPLIFAIILFILHFIRG